MGGPDEPTSCHRDYIMHPDTLLQGLQWDALDQDGFYAKTHATTGVILRRHRLPRAEANQSLGFS